MKLTLRVWRQASPRDAGRFVTYEAADVNEHMSFLEMLDVVNEGLVMKGEEPIAFEHDCREGICGSCGFMINGGAHGPHRRTTVCQLHMRHYKDGDTLTLEPWRARAFPVVKDLVVDRSAFDFRDPIPERDDVRIRMVDAEEGTRLAMPVYEAIRPHVPGMLVRPEAQVRNLLMADAEWMRRGDGIKYRAVIEVGGEVRGYVTYRVRGEWSSRGPGGQIAVVELMALGGVGPKIGKEMWLNELKSLAPLANPLKDISLRPTVFQI